MGLWRMTFDEAVAKADHLIALGDTDIYLYEGEMPWSLAQTCEAGSSYRLSGPSSVSFKAAHPSGLSFRWSVDFEGMDANGTGRHQFDRDRLREVMRKLPAPTRVKFGQFLETEVLPGVKKLAADIRASLNQQQDSEDCVVGLIQFAREPVAA
jgi:hypothetical protein